MRLSALTCILFLLSHFCLSQYGSPVDFPISLSGNFGELRNNHFHSGIDIKTQGVINKPVYSVEDGYVSRISVSPSGYGLALYITHPHLGQVSVYGHLQSFAPRIAGYVKTKQYEEESYKINIYLSEDAISVKKGDLVAYSGNTGSSGGPHIHFEIRDEKTENILDPLQYFKDRIKDTTPPEVRGIAVYPIQGKGVVNNSREPFRQNISKNKNGQNITLKPINAWGIIGIGIKGYDRMTGTTNIYGIRNIRLSVDGNKIFESTINTFHFDETRMLNSFIDFEDWRKNKSFFMKSYVEPGNTLPFYETTENGYITIDEERKYVIKYELTDIYDNSTVYTFTITGKKQEIPRLKKGSLYMAWDTDNHFLNDSFSLIIPKGNLYQDFIFTLDKSGNENYFSTVYSINDTYIPFHDKAEIKVKIDKDTLSNKSQYGLVSLNNGKEIWMGGTYVDGLIKTSIRETGQKIAVSSDTKAPVITPIQQENWEKEGKIRIRANDEKSGIKSCKGTIDGDFVLFVHDMKSPVYTYTFDPERLDKGQKHQLIFTAEDNCGNISEYSTEFYY